MVDPITYRGWFIHPNLASPDPSVDWLASHRDFDGAPDSGDGRAFAGPSIQFLRDEIDEWELTHPERVYDRTWVKCPTCVDGCVADGLRDGTEKLSMCEDCLGYGGWFEG